MKRLRDTIFLHPSWLAKLIAGEANCEWRFWFKSHFQDYETMPSDFNLTAWNIKHTSLLRSYRDGIERLGYKTLIEDQNSFKLKLGDEFNSAVISGKPDLLAFGRMEYGDPDCVDGIRMIDTSIIADAKSGRCKTSDHIQVILYMIILPMALEEYRDTKFDGVIVYRDGVKNVDIPSSAADDESLEKIIWNTIKKISGLEADCRKTPSRTECKWCDITCVDCSEKIT